MPRIIDDETFYKVQKIMDERKQRNYRGRYTKYLLSGFLVCGVCGRAISGSASRAGRSKSKYITYVCTGRRRFKLDCDTKPINQTNLDFYTAELLKYLLADKNREKLYDVLEYSLIQTYDGIKEKISDANKKILNVDKEVKSLVTALSEESRSRAYKVISAEIDSLANSKDRLEVSIIELTSHLKKIPPIDRKAVSAKAKELLPLLESRDLEKLKKAMKLLIFDINMTSERIRVKLRFDYLLTSEVQIFCIVEEERDKIALRIFSETLDFSELKLL